MSFPRSLKTGDHITYKIYGGEYSGVVVGRTPDDGSGYIVDLLGATGISYDDYYILPSSGGNLLRANNLFDLDPI